MEHGPGLKMYSLLKMEISIAMLANWRVQVFFLHPLKIKMEPNPWRFGSDHFPF